LKEEINELQEQNNILLADKKVLKAKLEERITSVSKENEVITNRRKILLENTSLNNKLLSTIEMTYKHKCEQLNNEIKDKQVEIDSLLRQNRLLKHTLDNTKADYKREIRGLKERRHSEYDKLSSTVQELQIKLDTSLDEKENKNLDYKYKQMYPEMQKKLVNAESIIESLESNIRILKHNNDSLNDQLKLKENKSEMRKKKLEEKIEKLQAEIEKDVSNRLEENKKYQTLLNEYKEIKSQLYDLQFIIEKYRKRDLDVKGILEYKDGQASRIQIQAFNEASALKIRFEQLEFRMQRMEKDHTNEIEKLNKKLKESDMIIKELKEEKDRLLKQMNELDLKSKETKNDYNKILNEKNELASIKPLYDNALVKEKELIFAKRKAELLISSLKNKCKILLKEKCGWGEERMKLQKQIVKLTTKLESSIKESAEKINRYARKTAKYRTRVRQEELHAMSLRLAHSQLESYQDLTPSRLAHE